MVNSSRTTQPFSSITHTNGTECNISSLRKPLSLPPHAISDTELSLYLPSLSPASLSLPASFHMAPWLLVHFSLRLFVGEKRPPAVVPLERWVGEKYRLNLFPFFLQSLLYAYLFQVQHQTLESWQNAGGETGLGVYLKMLLCGPSAQRDPDSFYATQTVGTFWKTMSLISCHTDLGRKSPLWISMWSRRLNKRP